MKILVTGASGFLGKRVIQRLNRDGIEYIPVSRALGFDLRKIDDFRKIFEVNSFDYILHAAAFVGGIHFGLKHQGELFYNNSLITTHLFELAREFGVKRIVNPIPNCSYPRDVTGSFLESQWWDGELDASVMVYGFIRKASWVQSYAYHAQYGLETINLVVPNMYGPEDHFEPERSHALGALIKRIYEAHLLNLPEVVIWGSGKPVREWLYIDDCVEAMIRALKIPFTNQAVNIGIGSGISILELAKLIKDQIGYTGNLTTDPTKIDGAPYKVMNIDRCKQVFGWNPPTNLEQGLGRTIAWYKENILRLIQ